MKTIKANDNYILCKADKSEVYGNVIYTPDNFDETSVIEITLEEGEEIKKLLEEKQEKEMERLGE
jgi:hypothetical protein